MQNPEYRDIEFDRYGDMSFVGNDISMTIRDIDYVYQNIIDRIITNFGDYYLYNNMGANLSSYIGTRVDTRLEAAIIKSIKDSLTKDGFLSPELIDILTLVDNDSVMIKIQIGEDGHGISEKLIINSIFNTSSGLLYVTN